MSHFAHRVIGRALIVEGEIVAVTLSCGHTLTGEVVDASSDDVLRLLRTDKYGAKQKHVLTDGNVETLVNTAHIAAITVAVPEA